MPTLLSSGQKQGTILSGAIQIPVEWAGARFVVSASIPENQNTSDRSFWLHAEISDNETGPFTHLGAFRWRGGSIGKDGTWSPASTRTMDPANVGKWVRARLEVPVRTRFAVNIDKP